MENLSVGEIVTLLIGGILALSGAVSTVGGAIEKNRKSSPCGESPRTGTERRNRGYQNQAGGIGQVTYTIRINYPTA